MKSFNGTEKNSIWKTFLFILGATFLSFGGGNAVFPFIKRHACDKNQWLNEAEFDDLVLVTNMIPGPSVIEALSYIAIKRHKKLIGTLITLIALIPHLAFFLVIFYVSQRYFPLRYLYVLNAGVIPVVVASLLILCFRYFKQSRKELALPLMLTIFLATVFFALFIPSPYNISAIVLIVILIVSCIYVAIKESNSKKT